MNDKCPNCGKEIKYSRQSQHKGARGLQTPTDKDKQNHLKNCKK